MGRGMTGETAAVGKSRLPFHGKDDAMPGYRKTRSIIYALALAFGLAACGGGGGGSSGPMTDPAVEQRRAIGAAVRDATTAVAALDEEPDEAALAAAEAAIEAAKTAVMDADALTMDETDIYDDAIARLEARLAPAMMRIETARAEEAAGVLAAFDGPGIGEIGATVVHGAAPAMAGTVLATPPVTVRGLATVPVAGSRVTAGAWTGGAYTASDGTAGVRDRVVLYTDIAAPGARPFSGEGGKYDSSSTVWIRVFFIINALGADFGRVAPHFAGCAEPGPMWLVRPPQGFPSRPPPRRRCGVS